MSDSPRGFAVPLLIGLLLGGAGGSLTVLALKRRDAPPAAGPTAAEAADQEARQLAKVVGLERDVMAATQDHAKDLERAVKELRSVRRLADSQRPVTVQIEGTRTGFVAVIPVRRILVEVPAQGSYVLTIKARTTDSPDKAVVQTLLVKTVERDGMALVDFSLPAEMKGLCQISLAPPKK